MVREPLDAKQVAKPWISLFQAHIKSALIGASVTIPIKDGKLVSFNTVGLGNLRNYSNRFQYC